MSAERRDALLLLLLQGGVLAWTWERGTLLALGGAAVAAALFALLAPLLRQNPSRLWRGLPLLLGSLPAALLLGRATASWMGSAAMATLLAVLMLGWQLWLFFWATARPSFPPSEEASHGRVGELDTGG